MSFEVTGIAKPLLGPNSCFQLIDSGFFFVLVSPGVPGVGSD